MIDWDNELELFDAIKGAVDRHLDTGERVAIYYSVMPQPENCTIVDKVWVVDVLTPNTFDLPANAILYGTAWNGAFYFSAPPKPVCTYNFKSGEVS